jgi:hypothetical protein
MSLRVVATHALAVVVTLANVFPLRAAFLDMGALVVLLQSAIAGGVASSRHLETDGDGDDGDEDGDGVSLRRLTLGCEFALLQLLDVKFAEGGGAGPRMPPPRSMSVHVRHGSMQGALRNRQSFALQAARDCVVRACLSHLGCCASRRVVLCSVVSTSSVSVAPHVYWQGTPRELYYAIGTSGAHVSASGDTYQPTALRRRCRDDERRATECASKVLQALVTPGVVKVRLSLRAAPWFVQQCGFIVSPVLCST